jgi:predicted Rdx family selenoprotein
MDTKPVITIEYCRQCRWLMRAAWMQQELLTTFAEELGGVTLAGHGRHLRSALRRATSMVAQGTRRLSRDH